MNKLEFLQNHLNTADLSQIESQANGLAQKLFIPNLSVEKVQQFFNDTRNTLDDYLNDKQLFAAKTLAFYYFFEQAVVSSIDNQLPNPLTLSFYKMPENPQLHTDSKKFLLHGVMGNFIEDNHAPLDEYFKQTINQKVPDATVANRTPLENAKQSLYADVFSSIIFYREDGIEWTTNQFNDIANNQPSKKYKFK